MRGQGKRADNADHNSETGQLAACSNPSQRQAQDCKRQCRCHAQAWQAHEHPPATSQAPHPGEPASGTLALSRWSGSARDVQSSRLSLTRGPAFGAWALQRWYGTVRDILSRRGSLTTRPASEARASSRCYGSVRGVGSRRASITTCQHQEHEP